MSTSVSTSYRNSYSTANCSLDTKKYGPTYIMSSETQADLITNGAEIDATIRKYNLQKIVANVASKFLKEDQYTTSTSLQIQLIDKGFGRAEWSKNHSFESLMEELGTCKYLYAFGCFATGNYKKLGSKTKFHEKEVVFLDKFDTNPLLKITQLKKQAIVIVGAIEETQEGKVLYIDPTEGVENPTIYGIDYTEFCKYVLPMHQEKQDLNNCYLLKRVHFQPNPASLPATPRKTPTPRKLIEPKPVEHSTLTTINSLLFIKLCDFKPHHISAFVLMLNQYDQIAKAKASALQKGFNKYWRQEESIKQNLEYLTNLITVFKNNKEIPFAQQIQTYISICKPNKSIVNFLHNCCELKKNPQEHLEQTVTFWRLENSKNLLTDLSYCTTSHLEKQKSSLEQAPLNVEEKISKTILTDFGFQTIPFKPLTSFAHFKKEMSKYTYLYAFGYFAKNNWASDLATQTLKDKKVICLEGDTVQNKQFSSIIIFGYVDTDSEQSILFINPENEKINQSIYKLDYATFCQHVRPISDAVDFDSDSYLMKYQGS